MKIMWAQFDFFPDNIHNFAFSDKEKFKFQKFFQHGLLWPQVLTKL